MGIYPDIKPKDQIPVPVEAESWWAPSLRIFLNTTSWIAFPIIIALYVGDWLDKKYGTEQKYLLISIAFAFVVSMSGLTAYTLREMKKIKKVSTIKKTIKKDNSSEDNT